MEKGGHYPHPTGFALAMVGGIIYAACVAVIALWPTQALQLFGSWMHGIDLAKVWAAPQFTIGGFLRGLVSMMVALYVVGFLYAVLYNKCVAHCRKRGWL